MTLLWGLQERLYAWVGGLRASTACNGLLAKLADMGLGTQQRMKLEALRVSHSCSQHLHICCAAQWDAYSEA